MAVEIVTFGCRLNAYDSEVIRLRAQASGLTNAVVVNTCAVTGEAVRQSRQAIRKLKRECPERRVIVTGCAAQIEPQTYAAMPEVDRVLGNREKFDGHSYGDFGLGNGLRVRVSDIMSIRETAPQMVDHFEGRARAFLQIQTGCDHRCTFCVIPYGRGNSRSVPMGGVVAEASRLAERGFAEIVLTGVDITSYGADLLGKPSLGQLILRLLKLVPKLKRLRLSSIDSIEADPKLMQAVAQEERLMPHFHLSVQSGDDLILKRMKRRHRRADTIAFCNEVRRLRPGAQFGADFIVGFPTESETNFENSLKLVDEAGLSQLHVFPFSPRQGTPAARMPQLDQGIAKARGARLRDKGHAALVMRLAAMAGKTVVVLVEKPGFGHAECFAPVRFGGAASPGSIVAVTVQDADGTALIGEAA
ncbi:MAG: tRNA (N(6)-L-threonylcarbamoyladenosine(37)-C(2))-methylthiotransferase MtaB [Rhizomicrobium sp.]